VRRHEVLIAQPASTSNAAHERGWKSGTEPMTWKPFSVIAVPASLLAFAACGAEKSSNPLSPSIAGPIAGVEITTPVQLEPPAGTRFRESQQPIRLTVSNAISSGVRPLYYMFEVATDSTFQTKMYARSQVPPGEGGRTGVQIDRLELGRTYYWRARAEDGANSSAFVTSQFELLPRAQLGPPPLLSPINNERTATRRPVLIVGSSERNAAVGPVRYEIQVAADEPFSQLIAADILDETPGGTGFGLAADLAGDRQYFWRARATDGEATSSWSPTQGFRTPGGGGGGPGPGPLPGDGGSCASTSGPFIVGCIANKYPDRLAAGVSLDQRTANMEFLRDRVIEAGICGGLDLARNLKRGVGPHSIDAIAWRLPSGAVEVVDIGAAWDDTSSPLVLTWGIVAGPPGYDPYPRPSCQ
jgi:hypothetical protein